MYYLCSRKSGDTHTVRIPALLLLIISYLRGQKVYMQERGDVHPVATAPIPVATGPVLGSPECLSVSAGLGYIVNYS